MIEATHTQKDKHVVFAWELGTGYGRVAGLKPFVEALLHQGFKVTVIARLLDTAHTVLGHLDVSIFQAPFFSGDVVSLDKTYTLAEVLLGYGYADTETLLPTTSSWVDYLSHLEPDLVVTDAAPTAVLACRVRLIPFITLDSGFYVPPATVTSFTGMPEPEKKRRVRHESRVINAINGVLTRFGTPSIGSFVELFSTADTYLFTLPELDYYPGRKKANYLGSRFDDTMGGHIEWPVSNQNKRIFAYLHETTNSFERMFKGLSECGCSVIAHVPHPSRATTLLASASANLTLCPNPVLMQNVYEEADLIVCEAGHGVVSGALLHGCRLLLVPASLEQNILAFRLTQQKLAMAVPQAWLDKAAIAIDAALRHPEPGANAERFRGKYEGFSRQQQTMTFLDACERLLN